MKTPKEIVNIAKAKQEHDNTWNYSWLPGKDFVSSVLAGGLRLYFSFYGVDSGFNRFDKLANL